MVESSISSPPWLEHQSPMLSLAYTALSCLTTAATGAGLVIALSWLLALIKLYGILLNFFRFYFHFSKLTSWKETQINIMIQLKILLTWSQFIKTI